MRACTKTFALIASVVIALTVLPPLAHSLFRRKKAGKASWKVRFFLPALLIIGGAVLAWKVHLLALILQFLPSKILTFTGRGSDIMVPMAIPSFGGMIIAMLTVFVVPVLYCWVEEGRVKAR